MQLIQLRSILFFIFATILFFQKLIAQPLDYHSFANEKSILGIPNFWNVASNIPFFFIGLHGLWSARFLDIADV